MSTNPPLQPARGMQILKMALYILAGLILAFGLISGIRFTTSANALAANALMPLQILGGGAIANLIRPMLLSMLINLGLLLFGLSLIFSALLYALGRLIGHIAQLEARLARLEARTAK